MYFKYFFVILQLNNRNCNDAEDKERNKTARECLGKFFYDLAKTCFLVMVGGNAITIYSDGELKIFNITSIIIGLFLTWLFAYIANKVLIKK